MLKNLKCLWSNMEGGIGEEIRGMSFLSGQEASRKLSTAKEYHWQVS